MHVCVKKMQRSGTGNFHSWMSFNAEWRSGRLLGEGIPYFIMTKLVQKHSTNVRACLFSSWVCMSSIRGVTHLSSGDFSAHTGRSSDEGHSETPPAALYLLCIFQCSHLMAIQTWTLTLTPGLSHTFFLNSVTPVISQKHLWGFLIHSYVLLDNLKLQIHVIMVTQQLPRTEAQS